MASEFQYTYRAAKEEDVAGINVIVNYEVQESVNNFNYSPRSQEDALTWYTNTINGGYPILVATIVVDDQEVIAGYSSLGSFRQKDGYKLYGCTETWTISPHTHMDPTLTSFGS